MPEEIKEWEEISREEIFSKYGRGMEKVVFKLPNGKEADFFLNSRCECIACVALTQDRQVILVKQFRPGPKSVLFELPGGGLEKGENLEVAMARELLEETGYEGDISFVTSVIPDAYAMYTKNAFVAMNCRKVAESKLEDNGESLEVVLMSLDNFRDHLRSGKLSDVEIGYLGLDFLGLL